jgi:enoyl-CoA hydratase/carnithine racemase
MEDLRVHMDDAVPHLAWITLDRPDARNAWSDPMLRSFVAAIDQLEADDDVRCVALTGEGRSFSAGGDLKAMRDKSGMFEGDPVTLRSRYTRGIQSIPRRLSRFDKPLIAAVNGAAIGAGLDLACMCDIRVAVRGAKMGSTFVKVGLIPGDGGAWLLSRTIGYPAAMDLVLTGRVVDADEGLRLGLVHEVCEADVLVPAVRRRASQILANSPLAVRLAKSAMQRSWDLPMDVALELAATYQGVVQNTDDHLEGVNAILDKRDPSFTGS